MTKGIFNKGFVTLNEVLAIVDAAPSGSTNLGYISSATNGTVTSSTGTNAILTLATPTAGTNKAGLMIPADKTKLDAISGTNTGDQTITLTGDITGSGAGSFATLIAANVVTLAKIQNAVASSKLLGSGDSGIGIDYVEINLGTGLAMSGTTLNATGATNLGYTASATDGTVTSSTGTDATLPAVTPTAGGNTAGLLIPADKTKLDGVATGATANSSNATLLDRANHTGTQATSTISGGTFADALVASSNITQHVGDINHDALLNYAIAQHRIINDSGTTTIELLSASKILSLISAVSNNVDTKEAVDTSTEGLGNITLSGEQTLNGVTTSTSRVIVTEQTLGENNGIYVTAAGAWARSDDANVSSEVTNGMTTRVLDASSTKYRFSYTLVTSDPITLDTTPLVFDSVPSLSFGTTTGTSAEGNDSRILSQDENNAALGTDGTPSNANRFVTNSDSRNTDSRTCDNTFDSAATAKTNLSLVKGDVGLGNVVDSDTTTTSNITDSTDKRFLTDAQEVLVDNSIQKDGSVAMTGAFDEKNGSDIASAATIDLETATGNNVDVTGTTAITAVTLSEGHQRKVRFTGILVLTEGASLVLPTGANITTAVGDYAVFTGYAAGVVRLSGYERADGTALAGNGDTAFKSSFDATTSWGSASGGLYTITIPATTHGKGTNVTNIILYETDAGDSTKISANTAFFDEATGDVSFTVAETPNNRFAGTVAIQGDGISEGEMKPAFLAYSSVDQTDVTGDGTDYTVTFDTEVIDNGGDFASNTFTAPVKALYQLGAIVKFNSHTGSNTTGRLRIVTTKRTYEVEFDPANWISGAGEGSLNLSMPADMDALDTATVHLLIFDSTKTIDIQGGSSAGTMFSGSLLTIT